MKRIICSKQLVCRSISVRCCAIALLCALAVFSCKTTSSSAVVITEPTQAKEAETPVDFAAMLNSLLERGDTAGALELYNYMPDNMKNDRDLQLLRVSLCISAGRNDEALLLLQELKASRPHDSDVLYLESILHRANGNDKNYEAALNAVLKSNPNHVDALAEMGTLMYAKRNWKKAGEYFNKSLSLNPQDPAALYGLARVQFRSEKYEESEATLNKAVEVDPSNDMVWADRAKARVLRGNVNGAIADITQAVTLRPQDPYYWYDLGRYELKLKHRDKALQAFSKSIECNPDYYLSYVYRAGMRDEDGDFAGAEADYRMITALNPRYYFANEALGILLWHQGRWAECREQFAAALRYQSTDFSYAMMYCACLQREGNQKEVQAFLKGVLPSQNRESLEYSVLRLYNDRTGENDVFIRMQKEKSVDKKAKAFFYLASYYEGEGNIELAQKYYLEAKEKVIQPAFFESRLIDWAIQNAGIEP